MKDDVDRKMQKNRTRKLKPPLILYNRNQTKNLSFFAN